MKGGGRGELRGVDATLENVISSLFALLLTAVVESLRRQLSPSLLRASPLSALSFLPHILSFHLTPAMGQLLFVRDTWSARVARREEHASVACGCRSNTF